MKRSLLLVALSIGCTALGDAAPLPTQGQWVQGREPPDWVWVVHAYFTPG